MSINVMTFNLRTDFFLDINNRWKDRKNIVYDVLKKSNCDIIGLQEVNNKMYFDISNDISEYHIVGSARTRKYFVERNDILVSKKHEILEHDTFWLSEKPRKIGSSIWYSLYPRICTTALVKLENGEIIRVYNTHLDVFLPKAREYGLRKIGEYIKLKQESEEHPLLLMGDFNAEPNSKEIKSISDGIYTDRKFIAVQEHKKDLYSTTTLSNFKGDKKGAHIDYIYVSEEFNILNVNILDYNDNGKYPSDHYPILAKLDMKRWEVPFKKKLHIKKS